jgi:hypothetical protein
MFLELRSISTKTYALTNLDNALIIIIIIIVYSPFSMLHGLDFAQKRIATYRVNSKTRIAIPLHPQYDKAFAKFGLCNY